MFGVGQKTTQEHLSWQNALYIEALQDIEPRVLEAACKQLIREGERFPKPKEIRDASRELADRRDAARTLANPTPDADLGSVMRNEAILLLGMFRQQASDLLGDPSEAWKNFLAEAANAWGRLRPEGGLAEADATKGGRAACGFALEAWARYRLAQLPLHPAYVTERVRANYRAMTGREIETLRPEDDPLAAIDNGLGHIVRRAATGAH